METFTLEKNDQATGNATSRKLLLLCILLPRELCIMSVYSPAQKFRNSLPLFDPSSVYFRSEEIRLEQMYFIILLPLQSPKRLLYFIMCHPCLTVSSLNWFGVSFYFFLCSWRQTFQPDVLTWQVIGWAVIIKKEILRYSHHQGKLPRLFQRQMNATSPHPFPPMLLKLKDFFLDWDRLYA